MLRLCNKCGVSKPLTNDYFHINRTCVGGLNHMCKVCTKSKRTEKSKDREYKYYNIKDLLPISEIEKHRFKMNESVRIKRPVRCGADEKVMAGKFIEDRGRFVCFKSHSGYIEIIDKFDLVYSKDYKLL